MAENSKEETSKLNKKLVVLDLDNTLCDFTYLQTCPTLNTDGSRPFLKYFLNKIGEYYDIIIWSATDYDSIQDKLERLGIQNTKEYKIIQCFDQSDLVAAPSVFGSVKIKSLNAVWSKYPQYNHTNTIIIDDQFVNFLQNPQNGLLIEPYFYCMITDNELILLTTYLRRLATISPDFSQENHNDWKNYNPNKE